MPALEQMDLNQDAVWWVKTGTDAYGMPTVSSPGTALRVRWNNKRSEKVQPDGSVVAYDAMVITDRAVAVGDMMWLGAIGTLPVGGLPTSNLMQVIRADLFKSLDGRNTRYEQYVMRYTNTLPV